MLCKLHNMKISENEHHIVYTRSLAIFLIPVFIFLHEKELCKAISCHCCYRQLLLLAFVIKHNSTKTNADR